ncbi:MAG: NAD-dependent epimerase/dehydratase family protein [Pseudomonadota bacterium]
MEALTLRVFILGGTGTIGRAVVADLAARSHDVVGLSRSVASDAVLRALGAAPCRGDLLEPEPWVDHAVGHDAVVQLAATFEDDMGAVDARVMSALVRAAQVRSEPLRVVYTGGCWLYGETGDRMASEETPFNPLPAFAWMVAQADMLLSAPAMRAAIIHPAIVYDAGDGGAFHRFVAAAKAGQPIEIWGSQDTRWPLIESSDLARAYGDLVERRDLVGHFNAVAEEGVPVGDLARTIARAYGGPREPVVLDMDAAIAAHGASAKGPMLDQRMSGEKLRAATGWAPQVTDFRQSCLIKAASDARRGR